MNVRIDNYTFINAILYVAENGVIQRIFNALKQEKIIAIKVEELALDSTSCKLYPDSHGALKNTGDSYSGVPILMDRAYEGDKTRELCQSFGHKPIVPPKKNRINPWEYDHELYKQRNIIERLFRWLKAFRRICTRYDKRDLVFPSFI